jgi:hypothetical protein
MYKQVVSFDRAAQRDYPDICSGRSATRALCTNDTHTCPRIWWRAVSLRLPVLAEAHRQTQRQAWLQAWIDVRSRDHSPGQGYEGQCVGASGQHPTHHSQAHLSPPQPPLRTPTLPYPAYLPGAEAQQQEWQVEDAQVVVVVGGGDRGGMDVSNP